MIAPHQPLPAVKITLQLTVAAAIVAGLGAMFGYAIGAVQAILLAVGFVWAVNVASVMFVAGFSGRGPMAVAMAHYIAAGGRILMCLLVGAAATRVFELPAKATWLAIAGAYLPLLMVEAVAVAGYIRRQYPSSAQEAAA